MALAAKLAKDAVNYRPSDSSSRRCGTCDMFRAGSCSLVAGRVEPRDVCDRWEAKAALTGLRQVHSYSRREHGKLEAVRGYESRDPVRKLLHMLSGSGKKYYPGQGFFVDAKGEKHWGWYGAAGLLVHHRDDKDVSRYLLQKRALSVQHGGTWSVPGGAIDAPNGLVETPGAAAFREAREEFGKLPPNLAVTGVDTQHFGTPGEPGHWAYHTVSASTPEMFTPKGAASHGFESAQAKWATPAEMAKLPLHPGFRPTALKLGMPDVPNPPPEKPVYQAPDPAKPEDYKPGMVVTWRHGGKTVEGTVKGWDGKPPKGKLPSRYKVTAQDGKVVSVSWYELRLKDAPKQAPVFPGGTTLAQSPGNAPKVRYFSKATPGMVHQIPGALAGQRVTGVYEHPKSGQLVVRLESGKHHVYAKSLGYETAQPGPGWQWLPGQSGALQKVVSYGGGLPHTTVVTPDKEKFPAEDPYWAAQAASAGLPAKGKLPPGPVHPKKTVLTPVRPPSAVARAKGQKLAAKEPRPGRNSALRRGRALRKVIEGR